MALGLVESLKNSDLILESKMVELNQKSKVTGTGLTRLCVKTLFYLGNKSHTTQLLTRILQNGERHQISWLLMKN